MDDIFLAVLSVVRFADAFGRGDGGGYKHAALFAFPLAHIPVSQIQPA